MGEETLHLEAKGDNGRESHHRHLTINISSSLNRLAVSVNLQITRFCNFYTAKIKRNQYKRFLEER